MTPALATQTSEAIDRLYEAIDHAESSLANLKPLIRRVAESEEADGHIPLDATKQARKDTLNLVDAVQEVGRHLRTLTALAEGEPCS